MIDLVCYIVAPVIIAPPQDVLQLQGRNVSFRCSAFGIPRPNIIWIFMALNNSTNSLNNTDNLNSSSEEVDRNIIAAELNLTNITAADFGIYSCIATNVFANIMEMASLKELSR